MITLETLKEQIATLREDHRKTAEKLCQITGALKVMEFLIVEAKKPEVPKEEGVKQNG